MSDFIPDPIKSYKPKQPICEPKPVIVVETPEIDPTDVPAVRAMVWDKLVQIAAVTPPTAAALPILREIMDRIEGKPSQSVNLDATIRQVTVNATIRFVDEIPVTSDNLIIDHVDNSKAIDNKQ